VKARVEDLAITVLSRSKKAALRFGITSILARVLSFLPSQFGDGKGFVRLFTLRTFA
jgi:hypothetical protein